MSKAISNTCMFCSNEVPVSFCKNCDCVLGKNCLTNHQKLPVFANHVIVILDETQKRSFVGSTDEHYSDDSSNDDSDSCFDIHLQKCSHHATENQTFYCLNHDVTICGRCLRASHTYCIEECIDLVDVKYEEKHLVKTLTAISELETMIEEHEKAVQENKQLNDHCMSSSLKAVDEFCSSLIKRISDLKENVYHECLQKHKQTSERLVKVKEKCDKQMLTVNKRKLLIETKVQLKHNRSLYIEAVRLKRDKNEILARIQQIREGNHMTQYSFCPNDKLEKVLLNGNKGIGRIHEKVDGSDELAEDTSVDEYCDCGEYMEFYPNEAATESYDCTIKDDFHCEDNLKFYRNEIASRPFPGTYVEDMLAWRGDYTKLLNEYYYIQWLFPIPASTGLNNYAQELTVHEAEKMQRDPVVVGRVLRSYEMMLNFYGMELVDLISGKVRRCDDNWEKRYAHLNRTVPSYIRIRRVLISLGQLGYERFQVPLVRFIMAEAKVTEKLPAVDSKTITILIEAIKDEDERFAMSTLLSDIKARPELFDQYGYHLK